MMMPKKNGYEICQAMREMPDLQGTKVVMLTAKGRGSTPRRARPRRADAYVTKPFATKDLVARVKAMLGDT